VPHSDAKPEFEKQKSVVLEPKQGIPSFYANDMDAMWTPHDIKLKFRELVSVTNATENNPKLLTYEERAAVILSWTGAKLLARMLVDIIEKYEKLNGEIKIGEIP
jgi:hypothetical protein